MKSGPFSSFVVFGSMRSGSNLLEKYLNQYEGLVCHGELFETAFVGKLGMQEYLGVTRKMRDKNPEVLLDAIRKADPDKTVGFRFFQTHNPQIMVDVLDDPRCAKIILTRDPVESFVSLEIARKTNQWLISDPAHRKEARILFDLADFADYAKERSAYYSEIAKSLSMSQQPFFEIDYSSLNEVSALNKLAAFLGGTEEKTALEQPIKRQNPGPLSEKILNYQEVCLALELPETLPAKPPVVKPVKEKGTDLSRIYFAQNKALALAPIPSVPVSGALHWLTKVDGKAPENGLSAQAFADWQSTHPAAVFFTVTEHPVTRAYDAFMRKIFPTASGGYHKIREKLEREFGVMLPRGEIVPGQPRGDLINRNYGIGVFVAGNLANQTGIRQDGKWQLQAEIIQQYQVYNPDILVFKSDTLRTDLAYLENRLGLSLRYVWAPEMDPRFSYALSEIYDEEIEALARRAYAPDYKAFGYDDLGGL